MKIRVPYLSFLVVLIIIFVSCKKEKESITYPPAPPQVPVSVNREYFWGIPWQKDSSGYVMNLDLGRLTDTAINRGVKVYVAIYSDWSFFYQLPQTLSDPFLTDTINLTFNLIPGHVQVFAKTPVEIKWPSDISILYQ